MADILVTSTGFCDKFGFGSSVKPKSIGKTQIYPNSHWKQKDMRHQAESCSYYRPIFCPNRGTTLSHTVGSALKKPLGLVSVFLALGFGIKSRTC